MSPECEIGSEEFITSKSDLYSAAKILWSAVTGMQVFARERPAFSSHSMQAMFPNAYQMWFLDEIFEKTIRGRPSDRGTPDELEKLAKNLAFAVKFGAMPLQKLDTTCSVCKIGSLAPFLESLNPFGPYGPRGVEWRRCQRCGFCFPIDLNVLQSRMERNKNLS